MGIALSSLLQPREAPIALPLHNSPSYKPSPSATDSDPSSKSTLSFNDRATSDIPATTSSSPAGSASSTPPRPGYGRIVVAPPGFHRAVAKWLCFLVGVPVVCMFLYAVWIMLVMSAWRF